MLTAGGIAAMGSACYSNYATNSYRGSFFWVAPRGQFAQSYPSEDKQFRDITLRRE
jgi:hypothetical protein